MPRTVENIVAALPTSPDDGLPAECVVNILNLAVLSTPVELFNATVPASSFVMPNL